MLPSASNNKGRPGLNGPTAILLLIAVIAFAAAARTNVLEAWYYDFLQQVQYKPASEQILLVAADSAGDGKAMLNSNGFQALAKHLNDAGARLVVAANPVSFPNVPGEKQISALAELEQRARRAREQGSQTNGLKEDTDSLTRQLKQFQDQYASQDELALQIAEAGNLLMSMVVSDYSPNNSNQASSCSAHAIAVDESDPAMMRGIRRIRNLMLPPQEICYAGRSIGYSNFWADDDGVIRRTELLLNADGLYYPSLSLATASAAIQPAASVTVAAERTLAYGNQTLTTDNGFTILNRYYPESDEQPAFRSVSASEVLEGTVADDLIRNHIVLLGQMTGGGYTTPVNDSMPSLKLIATSLSNLLEDEFLLRPDWLQFAEFALLLLIAGVALLWFPRTSTWSAILGGLIFATILLSFEAYLLIAMRVWVQLVTAALFAAFAIWSMHLWRTMTDPTAVPASSDRRSFPTIKAAKVSERDQLDLEFSVLRQQAPSDATKKRLYEIASSHGSMHEFAKEERVLAQLHTLDADYRDVREKLRKLSGAPARGSTSEDKPAESEDRNVTEQVSETSARQTLGRYEIDRVLGRGAMATVYLGRDPKINRQVAIKTIALAEEFDAEQLKDAKEQFLREAESAGRLNHPNIIAIYDAGEDGDVAYLAMEYFEGVALNDHSRPENLLPAKWVLELTARAAEALDYAHGQNVVHRDVKPANLLYNTASDTLKLTDFGIARLTDSSRTKTGIILGTPSYMSPEQLSAAKVTGQSDLYSLGITMYQLLAGQAPFRADSIPLLMDQIVNDKHPRILELKPDLPPCVDEILDQALAKDPNDRFQTGRAMALVLRDCCKTFAT